MGGRGGGGSGWGGGQGGCERRIEVFGKIQKIKFRGGGGREGGQVEVQGGCERNVGGRGDVGYGRCEPRIEGIVQCTKRYCTILRKLKKMWGEGQYLNPKRSLCI